jgi:hypothetical protein
MRMRKRSSKREESVLAMSVLLYILQITQDARKETKRASDEHQVDVTISSPVGNCVPCSGICCALEFA